MEHGEPERLANFISSLSDLAIEPQRDGRYGHVGATLADAVLQANNNYDRNVRPRINRILVRYSSCTTLGELKELLRTTPPHKFLQWDGERRAEPFMALVELLDREDVDTEDDLRRWLERDGSKAKLLNVPFVGPKTADYLKILVGLPTAAIDVHLFNFIKLAGLERRNYERALKLIHDTADLMHVDRSTLDYSIWRYMSSRAARSVKSNNSSINLEDMD
jgi:endonuclease III